MAVIELLLIASKHELVEIDLQSWPKILSQVALLINFKIDFVAELVILQLNYFLKSVRIGWWSIGRLPILICVG